MEHKVILGNDHMIFIGPSVEPPAPIIAGMDDDDDIDDEDLDLDDKRINMQIMIVNSKFPGFSNAIFGHLCGVAITGKDENGNVHLAFTCYADTMFSGVITPMDDQP